MGLPYGLLNPEEMLASSLGANPVIGEAPQPQRAPRLWERITAGTGNLLDSIRKRLTPTPEGFEGLLSEQEIDAARPGALFSLLTGPGNPERERYFARRLDETVQRKAGAEAMQKQRVLEGERARIGAQYPITPDMGPKDVVNQLTRMYGEFARINDTESLGKIGEVLKSIGGEGNQPSVKEVDIGDAKVLVDPRTGQEVNRFGVTDTKPPLTPYQQEQRSDAYWRKVDTITNQFVKESDRAQVVAEQLDSIEGVRLSALKGSPQAQMALIFAFMRLNDPNSAVREGEYHKAEMLRGVPDIVRNAFNKLRNGQFLSDGEMGQVQGFLDTADKIAREKMRAFDRSVETLKRRARQRGIDPEDVVVTDHFAGFRERIAGQSGDAPATGAAPTGNRISTLLGRP